VIPPPQPAYFNATALWSESRLDSALCLSNQCYEANAPGQEGDYVTQSIEGVGIVSAPSSTVVINGQTYNITQLNLCFSFEHNDNYIATNSTCPDATYTVTFSDGWVLNEPAPGSVPLQVRICAVFCQFPGAGFNF
jgi:hypothetical protein